MTLLACLAVPWSVLLTIGGLWLIAFGPRLWPSFAAPALSAGLTMAAAGQLVFMVCIADRAFPAASRRVAPWVEVPVCVMVLGGCVMTLGLLVRGLL